MRRARYVPEEQEAHASRLDAARADAQRSFESDGVDALAAAGCMEATLLRLGLLPALGSAGQGGRGAGAGAGGIDVARVEAAYKKGLANNHPDRSAARGDDLAGWGRLSCPLKHT